jgi:hypothetical protein
MNLIDEGHKFPVFVADENGDVVDTRPGEVEYFALRGNRHGMSPDNHFFALGHSTRPSAMDKKSFSMASWPIFA